MKEYKQSFYWETNLCTLRANNREVSGHPEHEVFHFDEVISTNAGGLIH